MGSALLDQCGDLWSTSGVARGSSFEHESECAANLRGFVAIAEEEQGGVGIASEL